MEVRKLATASGIKHILGKPAEPQQILQAVHECLKQPTERARLPQTGQLQREHLQLLADKLYEKNLELEKTNERLRNLSLTDELTGLNNRRGFMILANGLLKFSRRANHPLCLLYIDMDSLKNINDTFGHAHGDSALTYFAHILTRTFRDSDVIARMGGDEFAVLTIDATEGSLKSIQARLQSNVDTHNLESGRDYALSFSLGIIRVDLNSTFTVEALLAQADEAMYAHKKEKKEGVGSTKASGVMRLCIYPPLFPSRTALVPNLCGYHHRKYHRTTPGLGAVSSLFFSLIAVKRSSLYKSWYTRGYP